MKNLLVAQSGGPTSAINATLVGVLQEAAGCGKVDKVYGAKYGIEGVFNEQFIELKDILHDKDILDTLCYTPASALGTCRCKLKNWREDEAPYKKIIDIFTKYQISYFIYIGGNDSMDTVNKLSDYCKEKKHKISVIGAPKTVDNDLRMTDHSPGFGSAAKYIAVTISELERDIGSYDIPAVTLVEIMGRNAGWLTAAAALARLNGGAGADLIYLCEKVFDYNQFLQDVKMKMSEKPGILIAISEGIKDKHGAYVSDKMSSGILDNFGHKYLAGAARALEHFIREKLGCKVRSIELNLMQRAAAHIVSETDIYESRMLGRKALEACMNNETGQMAAMRRISDVPYEIEYITVPVEQVANDEKTVPMDWITPEGNDVTEELIAYMKPLIQGETRQRYGDGIPKHIRLF